MNYPNPCDTCTEECSGYHGCDRWEMRFRTIWKQFNSYPLRQYRKGKTEKVFAYEHPDVLQRYLAEGPCKKCPCEKTCDVACPAYWSWWDARMTVLRKKYHCEKRDSDG